MVCKKSLFLFLLFVLILGVSTVSATDDANITLCQNQQNDEVPFGTELNDNIMVDTHKDENIVSEDILYTVMYVGQNTSEEGGNGSYENPFSSLKLACDNVNEGDNVTLNIFNGTYYVGSQLNFKSSNLVINGLGTVIIKNELSDAFKYQGLSLSFPLGNLTINNVAFDQSEIRQNFARKFYPVICNSNINLVEFNNCSFIGGSHAKLDGGSKCNLKFINCILEGYGFGFHDVLFADELLSNNLLYFENCIFLNIKTSTLGQIIRDDKNVSVNGAWFGDNNVPDFLTAHLVLNHETGKWNGYKDISILRYAIFSVSEHYLGDNQYEIIGKLCWNGTNDTVGDSFHPMTVTLSSSTGDIVSEILLENGTFKTFYTSNSPNNKVTATLDYETIDLLFTTVDIQASSPSIYYGDDQNITVTFLQPINAIISVIVNNKTYNISLDNDDVIIYQIEDILLEGNYTVDVVLIDKINHIYGFQSTILSVYKVKEYTFDSIMPGEAKVGDEKTIIIELPEDATGNIIIQINEQKFIKEVSQTTEINITGFVFGDNFVTVTYSGDNKYVLKTCINIITAEKVDFDLNNETLNVNVLKGTTIPSFNIVLPSDATGNLTVIINGKNYTQELVNGSANVNILELNPGMYNSTVIYSGDSKYNSIITNTTFSISKPVLTAKSFSMLYTAGTNYVVRVTLDGNAVVGKKVSFTINGKKTTASTNKNGYASVKITLPPKSKAYTVTATYLGVKITNKVTVKSILVAKNMKVKKSAKKLIIKVTLKKVNKKYLKGKTLTLKFKGKTYKVKTNKKGVATFKINKNVLKKLKIGKKYLYKVTYGKDSVNKKIIIKK